MSQIRAQGGSQAMGLLSRIAFDLFLAVVAVGMVAGFGRRIWWWLR